MKAGLDWQKAQNKRSCQTDWKFFTKKSTKISFGLEQIVELGSGKFNPHVQPNQQVPNFCEKCVIFAAINMELQAPIIIEAD